MKNFIKLMCGIILIFGISSISTAKNFDKVGFLLPKHHTWKIDYAAKGQDGQAIYEYVPPNETVNNWSEMITYQYMPLSSISGNYQTTLGFMNALKSMMLARCPETVWKIISQKDNQIIYQFQVKNCGTGIRADQTEMTWIGKSNDGFYLVHYVIKGKTLSAKQKQRQKTFIQSIEVR